MRFELKLKNNFSEDESTLKHLFGHPHQSLLEILDWFTHDLMVITSNKNS